MNVTVEITFEIVENMVEKQRDFESSTCIIVELKDEIQRIIAQKLLAGHHTSLKSAFSQAWELLVAESPSY